MQNSLRGVESAISEVRNRLRNLNADSSDYDQQSRELSETLVQLRTRQGEFRQELGLTQQELQQTGQTVGGLRGALSGIWDSLLSGDLEGAKEGIIGLRTVMKGLVKSSMEFIATPIGATIAILAGIAKGAKELFDYNMELNNMNTELRALGVNAKEVSKVRDEIKATADTFEKDFKEVAEKANSLSKTYGISMSEANAVIARGLADGGAQNEEFLDSLGEYDEFFAKAGFSAKEFADVINTGYDLGIYQDKLPDALKEADLSLKENTKATRDALVNAFGATFSDEILNKVKTGEMTTKQALDAIAKKAGESQLSQQQYAQLTADVFKGAGEDAGGAQKVLEALGKASRRELDETAKASIKLAESNERLNKAQSEIFEIKSFSDVWTQIKTAATDALASVFEWLKKVKVQIQPLIDLVGIAFASAWDSLKMIFVSAFDIIGGGLNSFFALFGGIINAIVKLLKGDFKGAWKALTDGMYNAMAHIGNIFMALERNIVTFLQNILKNTAPILDALGLDIKKIHGFLESLKIDDFKIKGEVNTKKTEEKKTTTKQQTFGDGGGGATADAEKARQEAEAKRRADAEKEKAKQKAEEEKAAKDAYDRAKALADAKTNLAKAQLDRYIFDLRSNIDKEKALTPEILADEIHRLKQIEDARIKFNNDELARKIADLEAKAVLEKTSLEILNAEKEALTLEYQLKNQELELGFQQSTDVLKKQYEEKQKTLKAEQLAIHNELALAEADSKYEEDVLRDKQRLAEELARYTKLRDEKKITDLELASFKAALDEKSKQLERQREVAAVNSTLGALGTLSTALSQMFGQTKEMAIVQANISAAQSILSIWAATPIGPAPVDFAIKGILTAAVAIQTVSKIRDIQNQKEPAKPNIKKESGFYYGGFTGINPALGYDEYGPVTGYVHKNEYVVPEVMTQDPAVAPTIQWLEAKRQQKLKGYVDGGSTSPSALPAPSPQANTEQTALAVEIAKLNNLLSLGITAKVFIGYEQIQRISAMQEDINNSKNNSQL
ncbi:phage tail tape measure protein [Flavobacterium columnare]|uniref:phage tail tape measure protein n=1 Tax=Flavobacterium columnare TaxID=996 RepID=UPI0002E9E8B7|nr:phage tail tape measure protein [Flavobacterium columnare]